MLHGYVALCRVVELFETPGRECRRSPAAGTQAYPSGGVLLIIGGVVEVGGRFVGAGAEADASDRVALGAAGVLLARIR